uniref:Uncharacterized protein n=2 Tax=Tolypothrix TaxID=111782 RepID=A0A0C1REF5_9CYAN
MGVKVENQSPGDQDLNDFHSQLYFQDNLGKLYAYERWGIRIPGSGFTTSELMLKEPIQPNASTISVNFGDIGGKKLCISGIPVK